jgi:tetratricopeptide (TPR) repeat protein
MFRVYPLLALGRYDDAIRCCDRVIEVRGPVDGPQRPHAHAVALKGYALARQGRSEEAEAALAEIARQRREAYVPPTYDAVVLHGLGRDDEAIVQLQVGIDARDVLATFLGNDPTWDDIRDTPGFRGLLAQVNLLRG